MENFNFLRLNENSKKFLAIIFFVFSFGNSIAQVNCSPQTTNTGFEFLYSNTNAVSLTTSSHIESAGGPNYTVNVYTFTVPYFQNNFQFNYLRFKNGVSSFNCKQAGSGSSCTSKIKVFNSHSGGSLIASIENVSQLDLTNPLSLGVHNLRVEGTCGFIQFTNTDNVYRTAYYRIIVQQEPQPSLNLTINTACQQNNQGQNTGWVNFRASGTKPNNSKLYLRTVPPSGSSCSAPDVLIDNVSFSPTFSNSVFYTCNTNGLYTVKVMYKCSRIGGGTYSQEITPSGWTNFSWTKSFRSCLQVADPIRNDFAFRTNADETVSLYPNPAKSELYLEYTNAGTNNMIQIYDANNTLIKYQVLESKTSIHTIDISNLKRGLYVLKISGREDFKPLKFIKE